VTGKFDYAVDEVAHTLTMTGVWEDDQHEGCDQYQGNIWLIADADGFDDPDYVWEGQTPLSDHDRAFLAEMRAVVCKELTDGRFVAEWFAIEEEARSYFDRERRYFAPPADWDGE
jgi:hypothetical protein